MEASGIGVGVGRVPPDDLHRGNGNAYFSGLGGEHRPRRTGRERRSNSAATHERPNRGLASLDKELPHELVNSIGMKLVLIKPGTFLMGSPTNDPWGVADEQPQHSVEITRPFTGRLTQ